MERHIPDRGDATSEWLPSRQAWRSQGRNSNRRVARRLRALPADPPAPAAAAIPQLGGDPALAELGAVANGALDRMLAGSVALNFPSQQWELRIAMDRQRWVLQDAGKAPSRVVYQRDQ